MPLYHYVQRDSAISKSRSISIKTDILTAYKKAEELMNSSGYSALTFWARGFYCYHASVVAEIAGEIGDVITLQAMKSEINAHLDDWITTNKDFPEKFDRMSRLANG